MADMKALEKKVAATEIEDAVLSVLSTMLQAVRTEIVRRPCVCEVNAQGLMRCRRCLLLS